MNVAERAAKYISNMEKALKSLKILSDFQKHKEPMKIIDLAKRYLEDAKYYYEKGSYIDSIVCSSYAEGLLDSLKMLGLVNFSWLKKHKDKKVFIAGTFDIIHPGHIYLIKKASEYGKVFAIVAKDKNSYRFKGKLPVIKEDQRLYVLSNIKGVYKAMLGDEEDLLKSVTKVKPDVIILGPDQKISEKYLKSELVKRGLKNVRIIRLSKKFSDFPYCSTSSIVKRILNIYCK